MQFYSGVQKEISPTCFISRAKRAHLNINIFLIPLSPNLRSQCSYCPGWIPRWAHVFKTRNKNSPSYFKSPRQARCHFEPSPVNHQSYQLHLKFFPAPNTGWCQASHLQWARGAWCRLHFVAWNPYCSSLARLPLTPPELRQGEQGGKAGEGKKRSSHAVCVWSSLNFEDV